ncbi:MAG: hypothetical protein JHC87_09600, partial [Thermoleophilaceae bacterium]|nr:hypothetical protein [Thermoleophilaceae bacterium]
MKKSFGLLVRSGVLVAAVALMALVFAGPAAAKKGPKPGAGAGKRPLVGIGDNGASMFLDSNYRALN